MPYSSIKELPPGVRNNLPEHAQHIFMAAFNSALKDTCGGDDACASKVAWSAVGRSYEKKDGKWVKKESFVAESFSFIITKAAFDKATGKRKFSAIASDTFYDSYNERMSLELFSDFIDRANKKEQPPERFRSNFWSGGMPYLSVAHYFDLEGKGCAGKVTSLIVDGNNLKARGEFTDTPLGIAAYNAVKKSLNDDPNHPDDSQKKIRISIAFLDYGHQHGANPPFFRRSGTNVRCPYCEKGFGDVKYIKGLLIHLALTRVPVNERTNIIGGMEVDKSMGKILSRKDDAASIVGEELAETLEQESNLVGKSDVTQDEMVVVKSDEIPAETEPPAPEPVAEVVEEKPKITLESLAGQIGEIMQTLAKMGMPGQAPSTGQTDITAEQEDADEAAKDAAEQSEKDNPVDSNQNMPEMEKWRQYTKEHPAMMRSMLGFMDAFNVALQQGHQGEDLLRNIQQPYEELGQAVKSYVEELSQAAKKEKVIPIAGSLSMDDIRKAMSEVLSPVMEKVGLLTAELSALKQASVVQPSAVVPAPPPHRAVTGANLTPEVRSNLQNVDVPGKPMSIKEIARRSAFYGSGQ